MTLTEPTLLIVDDDPGTCKTLCDIFQEKGYTVATATTGREAQDKAKQTAFNVALIDIRLSDVDGTALLSEFKKTHPDMVCMIITGHASVQNAIKALEDGANGYFVKPLIIEEIVHRVAETLDKQRLVREKRHAEEALRESEEKYRTLYDSSRDAIMMLTPEEGFLSGNPAAVEIFGCKDEKEFTSRTPHNLSPQYQPDGTLSSEKDKQMMAIAMKKGSHFFEWAHKRMNGHEFPATVLLTRMELQGRRMLQATVRDITERKQAEEKIEASLREKGALLREIHHRVKNNLQIISSLLSMQARKAKDENVIVSLLDSRSRIQTMSLIHAQLYQSEKLEQVEMDTAIRKLVSSMLQIYVEAKKNITSAVTAEGITLPISQAIPCGLIINEFVSNALKHAFTGMAEGSVEISMRELAGDRIKLTVKDNGVGIPEELDVYKTDTLGLKIVRTLAEEQLKGKMGLIRDKGTEIYVEFKSITNGK